VPSSPTTGPGPGGSTSGSGIANRTARSPPGAGNEEPTSVQPRPPPGLDVPGSSDPRDGGRTGVAALCASATAGNTSARPEGPSVPGHRHAASHAGRARTSMATRCRGSSTSISDDDRIGGVDPRAAESSRGLNGHDGSRCRLGTGAPRPAVATDRRRSIRTRSRSCP